MTHPLRPLALAALAAAPVGAAQAALALSPSSPSFTCASATTSEGGSVIWPSGVSVVGPVLSYLTNKLEVSGDSLLDCAGGSFTEAVGRKSGEGQKDFLKVTMKEVFVSATDPAFDDDGEIKLGFTRALREVDGQMVYDSYWDVVGDDTPPNGLVRRNFIGFKFSSTGGEFLGEATIKYDATARQLTFVAPNQDFDGQLSLTRAPAAVPEPGSLALLGSGLVGMVAAGVRRRKRGW